MTRSENLSADEGAIILERHIDAPIARVYAAWIDPELMAQWYCPDPDLDLRVGGDITEGGDYTISMGPHDVVGTYRTLRAPTLIEFTWKWAEFDQPSSLVRVELTEEPDGTLLRLTHTGLSGEDDVRNHSAGWVGCLDRLPGALAA